MIMKHSNIIFNGVFGSTLYGLRTPTSDMDYKGIYIPDAKPLVFNTYTDTVETKIDGDDVTWTAITKFIRNSNKCDIVAVDMLHTPKEFTLETSFLWKQLQSHRSDLYCKNMRGILGYIKTQAHKYSEKVQRFDEMSDLLNEVVHIDDHVKVNDTELIDFVIRSGYTYIRHHTHSGKIKECINVCGSRYQTDSPIKSMKEGLISKVHAFGSRTKEGSMSGGDWKSLSHAVRSLVQLEEIIMTRHLVFPLKERKFIMDIKTGQLTQDYVMGMIGTLYDEVMDKLESSDLPEEVNLTNMEDCVMNYVEHNIFK